MANSQYSADSAPLPPLSLHSGMPGIKEHPCKRIPFPAPPVTMASSFYEAYVLACSTRAYIGKSSDCWRRLRDFDELGPKPSPSGHFPTTSSID
jgi:hypothetical protein